MSTICLNNIKVYGYHGVLEVEQKVGQWYLINLEIDVDFSDAALEDDINGTVDYAQLNQLIRSEMEISSKLIEHVASRIVNRIVDEFPQIEEGSLSVAKLNPPVEGEMESVEVIIEF